MPTIEQIIGMNVRSLRESKGWSQQDLGNSVGALLPRPWPPQTVSLVEKGERAFAATDVVALAIVLDATLAWLFRPPLGIDSVTVGEVDVLRSQLVALAGDQHYPSSDTAAAAIAGMLTSSALDAQEIARRSVSIDRAHRAAARFFEDEARRGTGDLASGQGA